MTNKIVPMTQCNNRPRFSVMIPTFNPEKRYLAQALRSVIDQDPGASVMQIEVVDDNSTNCDIAQLIAEICGDRVSVSRTVTNMGLAGCWNTCIDRARGEWVHILHQDDYVLPGFYAEIEEFAKSHPDVGLVGVRSFFVDDANVINGITSRITSLERGGHGVAEFLYGNPIQCPGIAIRKKCYESHGGFRSDLTYTLDWEMWTRIIASEGGVISPKVLGCYRFGCGSATDRMAREGETLLDMRRLYELFSERYEMFNRRQANRRLCTYALGQARKFDSLNEAAAARKYWRFWRANAPPSLKANYYLRTIYGILQRLHWTV